MIRDPGINFYQILKWTNKYAISGSEILIKIIDLEEYKIIGKIDDKKHGKSSFCVKKIVRPIYGGTLLSSGNYKDKYCFME